MWLIEKFTKSSPVLYEGASQHETQSNVLTGVFYTWKEQCRQTVGAEGAGPGRLITFGVD